MFEKFYPNFSFDKLEDIPVDFFVENRIEAIIFDMDNTLVNHKYKCTKEIKDYIKSIKKNNIKVCILSNSFNKRNISKVAKELSLKYLYFANKPFKKGFVEAQKLLGVQDKNKIAIIGDQVFTDIYGGNIYGIKTILVKPIDKTEFWGTKIKRPLENMIISKYYKNKKNEV